MGGSSSKLTPEVACRLQASTHFDKREINQLFIGFVKECPSGCMTRDDLVRIYRQFFPFGDPGPFISRLIQLHAPRANETTSVDGIEFGDYITGLSVISRGRLEEKLEWAFRFCDVDRDGWISKDDLLDSIELIHILLGDMFQLTVQRDPIETSPTSDARGDHDSCSSSIATSTTTAFVPRHRADALFQQMDEDGDGRAGFDDFKRIVLADPEILQGFILYDSVV